MRKEVGRGREAGDKRVGDWCLESERRREEEGRKERCREQGWGEEERGGVEGERDN